MMRKGQYRNSILKYILLVLDSKWVEFTKNRAFTLLPSLLLGATIWFAVTPNEDLTVTAIHLLAVFTR